MLTQMGRTDPIANLNRQLLSYAAVGVLTTALNLICYFALSTCIYYVAANAISWVVCLIFSFLMNKAFVFENSGWKLRSTLLELFRFFMSSVASGAVDIAFLYFLIDIAHCNDVVSKLIDTVLIILLNFLLRKFWVFHGRGRGEDPCT